MKPIEGPPAFRPLSRLFIETSHVPKVCEPTCKRLVDPVPMWLRELRRDKREQVL